MSQLKQMPRSFLGHLGHFAYQWVNILYKARNNLCICTVLWIKWSGFKLRLGHRIVFLGKTLFVGVFNAWGNPVMD